MPLLLSTLMVLGLGFSSLQAEDSKEGFYLGAGVGSASLDDDGYYDGAGTTLDDSSISAKLYGGYRFNDYIAAELELANIGSYDYTVASTKGELDLSAYTVSVVGMYPVMQKQLDLFILLGLGSVSYDDNSGSDDNGGVIKLGLGVAYTPDSLKQLSFRVGVDSYSFELEEIGFFTPSKTYDMVVTNVYGAVQYNF